jgi:hypothetical protein
MAASRNPPSNALAFFAALRSSSIFGSKRRGDGLSRVGVTAGCDARPALLQRSIE